MPLSMYNATVLPLTRALTNLRGELAKADEHVKANELKEAAFMDFRLFPNMLPFKWQVYIATDTAKFAIKRLAEIDPPSFEDNQETFGELIERVDATLEFLKGVKPEQIDGTEEREVVMKGRSGDHTFTGEGYLFGYALPNLYFHVTTAHDILRHNGIDIGKRDYLGPS